MTQADSEIMRPVTELLGRFTDSTEAIDWDRDLVEAGVLDSLTMVEFLLLLEEITGVPVDLNTTDREHLQTLNGISALLDRARARDLPEH
ncbi:phosphopantetheine-binding protein [Parafrankia discariae]|uniref:phosphopantetheine-binding protein n=1 Tax=Parafrankia discariae TaxID=365528 RepID=UPI000364BBEA|nr:phosphopantetheine-binding protein [Parafrankia discariae]